MKSRPTPPNGSINLAPVNTPVDNSDVSESATASLQPVTPTSGTNTANASHSASEKMTQPSAGDNASANKLDLAAIPEVLLGGFLQGEGITGYLDLRDVKALADVSHTMARSTDIKQLRPLHRLINQAELLANQCEDVEEQNEVLALVDHIKMDMIGYGEAKKHLKRAMNTLVQREVRTQASPQDRSVQSRLSTFKKMEAIVTQQVELKDFPSAAVSVAFMKKVLDSVQRESDLIQNNPTVKVQCVEARITLATLFDQLGHRVFGARVLEQASDELQQLSKPMKVQIVRGAQPRHFPEYTPVLEAFARIGSIARRVASPEVSKLANEDARWFLHQYDVFERYDASLEIVRVQVKEGDRAGASEIFSQSLFNRWDRELQRYPSAFF